MSLEFQPSLPLFAAEVSGVDLRQPLADDVFDEIHQAFRRYGVLVFHDQHLSDEEQIRFSERFGPLENAPNYAGNTLRLRSELTDISNLDHEGRILDPHDRLSRYNAGNMLWHTDSSFKAVRAKCSLLSARDVPTSGTSTLPDRTRPPATARTTLRCPQQKIVRAKNSSGRTTVIAGRRLPIAASARHWRRRSLRSSWSR